MTNRKFELILASRSPARRRLLTDHGFTFSVNAPNESVEKEVQARLGICSKCSPAELVVASAFAKAKAIAQQVEFGIVLAADSVAECRAEILGKPVNRDHAEKMLRLMSGREHRVVTGVCLWHQPSGAYSLHVEQTVLSMDPLSDQQLDEILDSDGWIGKAGGFGYQDGLDWLQIVSGLESNVIGLPVERLDQWIEELMQKIANQT